ncbi:hydantoinase/oxoprolinase family protein [Afifella sp. IM 167]|uniref:hydantoinase/oxoprolinase family protein n=1 Tax=Afifella sp. IM 167 TaxID=2033586 RepID=UPI001CCB17BB|nr:hydantoinase/oxoprolinase family protein [Afifella sp. IM 167]MBZ8134462.1 hypothetical protein [Afifella sp. IM 167]
MRLSVDVGGTFTDLVLVDAANDRLMVEKVSSTPGSGEGVIRGIREIARKAEIGLGEIELLFHGSTVATNAWLTRTGARVALIVTEGFRDILEIGDQRRPKVYSLTAQKPVPLVPRSQVVEVRERLDVYGKTVIALSDAEIDRVVAATAALEPEAVAVSLIFSFVNSDHERRLADRLRAALPDTPIYLASDVNPQMKEYPRTNTTAAAAYVGPPVARYTLSLERALGDEGVAARLVYMRSDGGAATPEGVRDNPLNMLLSGPAGGVLGALEAARLLALENVITFDMGGTSTDLALIRQNSAALDRSRLVDGLPLSIPMLEISAISAGGGSIGHVDPAGGLHVGPQSAGSTPGPACYGRGGEDPTLTDAALVLGYLDPAAFADPQLRLSRDAAAAAVTEKIARPLGLGLADAALGMVAIGIASMSEAVRSLSLERGYDPHEFALFAFGGAGGIFAPFLLDEIGIGQLVLPPHPGVFAAMGLQFADIRHSRQVPFLHPVSKVTEAMCAEALGAVTQELRDSLGREGIAAEHQKIGHTADMRYVGQYHELNIAFSEADLPTGADLAALAARFHAAHETAYGYADPQGPVEIVNLRVDATGRIEKPKFARFDAGASDAVRPRGHRDIVTELGGAPQRAAIYRKADLPACAAVSGPAIIEQEDTTILVLPNQIARTNEYGFVSIKRG